MEKQYEEHTTAEVITEYAALLWHWAWLLILLAAVMAGLAGYLSSRQTPIYQAKALAMINVAPTSQESYASLYYGQQLAESYARIMVTRPVLDAVVQRLGLERMEAIVQVTPIQNTQLMDIIVQDTDPERAAMIANTLVTVFSEQIQADQAARYEDSKQNLKAQLDVLNEQIQTTSGDLAVLGQEIQADNASLTLLLQSSTAGMSQDQLDQRAELIAQTQSTLQSKLSQQAQLQTVLQNYRTSYSILLQSYEAIRLAESQSSSGVLLKDPAVAVGAPVQPKPVRSAILAGFIGVILGAGVIFLKEYLDDSLRDPQEITRLWGIPILGMIVDFNPAEGAELITELQPRAPVSEAFRSLRTNLQFASVASPIRKLLVTSPSPQDGKTTVLGNLACVVAQSGRKVVVLDADLRKPRLHKAFQLPNRLGLTDQFIQPHENLEKAIQSTRVKNVDALTSGSLPPNPSELLGSPQMGEIFEKLAKKYDMVIVDTPPALVVTDANLLTGETDAVLLVICPSLTKRTAIRYTLEQLNQVKANVVGVVLNKVDIRRSQYKYYRSYSQKYGRGYSNVAPSEPKLIGKVTRKRVSRLKIDLHPKKEA